MSEHPTAFLIFATREVGETLAVEDRWQGKLPARSTVLELVLRPCDTQRIAILAYISDIEFAKWREMDILKETEMGMDG